MAAAGASPSPPRSPAVPLSETDPDPSPPSATPEIQSNPPPSASAPVNPRRPPPPCWSPDETVALIDIYSEKWHSLGRAALKLNHWQEVADGVASRCPVSSPPKTATQCRHKMEKLRKRYRAEIRRAQSLPAARFSSSWVHFKRMEAMDRSDDDENDEEDEEMDLDFYDPRKRKRVGTAAQSSGRQKYYPNGVGAEAATGIKNKGGFRIKIPTSGRQKFKPSNNANPAETGPLLKERQRHGSDPLQEVVSAVKVFREGFERMERMKMDMAKEIGAMQREMEMKRTQMILESQQFIVETLARVISEKNTKKRKSSSSNSKSEEAVERISKPEPEA